MRKAIVAAAILSAMLGSAAHAADKAERSESEKCYGVAKAGKNDCAAKDGKNSCAGRASKDNDLNNWIYVPKGLCDKLAGGIRG